jgi:hypothetical protein
MAGVQIALGGDFETCCDVACRQFEIAVDGMPLLGGDEVVSDLSSWHPVVHCAAKCVSDALLDERKSAGPPTVLSDEELEMRMRVAQRAERVRPLEERMAALRTADGAAGSTAPAYLLD